MKLSEQIRAAIHVGGNYDAVPVSLDMLRDWAKDAARLERTAAEPLAEAVGLVVRAIFHNASGATMIDLPAIRARVEAAVGTADVPPEDTQALLAEAERLRAEAAKLWSDLHVTDDAGCSACREGSWADCRTNPYAPTRAALSATITEKPGPPR